MQGYIELGLYEGNTIKGFTIKSGKKIYWYFIPTRGGMYRVFPIEEDAENFPGGIGWPRNIEPNTDVSIIYKDGE